MLEDNDRVWRSLCCGAGQRVLHVNKVVRWIENDQIEWPAGQRSVQDALDGAADDSTAIRLAAALAIGFDQLNRAPVAVDTDCAGRAAAERFERNRAGAGKAVQHAGVANLWRDDIEQRLSQLIR